MSLPQPLQVLPPLTSDGVDIGLASHLSPSVDTDTDTAIGIAHTESGSAELAATSTGDRKRERELVLGDTVTASKRARVSAAELDDERTLALAEAEYYPEDTNELDELQREAEIDIEQLRRELQQHHEQHGEDEDEDDDDDDDGSVSLGSDDSMAEDADGIDENDLPRLKDLQAVGLVDFVLPVRARIPEFHAPSPPHDLDPESRDPTERHRPLQYAEDDDDDDDDDDEEFGSASFVSPHAGIDLATMSFRASDYVSAAPVPAFPLLSPAPKSSRVGFTYQAHALPSLLSAPSERAADLSSHAWLDGARVQPEVDLTPPPDSLYFAIQDRRIRDRVHNHDVPNGHWTSDSVHQPPVQRSQRAAAVRARDAIQDALIHETFPTVPAATSVPLAQTLRTPDVVVSMTTMSLPVTMPSPTLSSTSVASVSDAVLTAAATSTATSTE